MRWQGRRQSENVVDRRGIGTGGVVGGGVGTIVLALLVYFLGGNPMTVLRNAPTTSGNPAATSSPEAQKNKEFVSVVLADTEDVWNSIFQKNGKRYQDPKLVLFTGQVDSACGGASAAVGPFYCGEDEKVYIDLSFYDELKNRFGASGDFAQAYVIAHEVGHHVQKLLGILDRVHHLQSQAGKAEANQLSVKLELQADYLAGVWAHYAKRMEDLDQQDIQEAIQAATAIGDDRLQKESQGYVVPESFTHGTSAQRVEAFTKGYETGSLKEGGISGMTAP
jgi:predicted metalloprotease